jgi:hypothetical protein
MATKGHDGSREGWRGFVVLIFGVVSVGAASCWEVLGCGFNARFENAFGATKRAGFVAWRLAELLTTSVVVACGMRQNEPGFWSVLFRDVQDLVVSFN